MIFSKNHWINCLALFLIVFHITNALPKPDGGVVAAAAAANVIDHERFQSSGPVSGLNRGPVVQLPQRRQHYYHRAPQSPFKWFAHYFLPQNWRNWGWRQSRPSWPANSWRRQQRPYYHNHGK